MMEDRFYTVRVRKRWARIALIVAVTALVVAPLTAVATHRFTDVPDSNTFHADIAWLADAGVTRGCNPPANTEFCPDDPVTREQMSAFMRRFAEYLSAEDGTPAEADHATAADSADHAATANAADDAQHLAGRTVAQLVPRAAFNSTGNATDIDPFTLSTEIVAPSPGVIITNAGIDAYGGPDDAYGCRVLLDGGQVPGSLMSADLDPPSLAPCSTGGSVAVEAGTHTVSLQVFDVDSLVELSDAFVWALWVPFDGSGDVPTTFTQLGEATDAPEEIPLNR